MDVAALSSYNLPWRIRMVDDLPGMPASKARRGVLAERFLSRDFRLFFCIT